MRTISQFVDEGNRLQTEAITYENVIVQRHNEREPALRGLTLSIPSSTFVVVCGQNGAGKSTFARTLVQVTPITSGRISIFGQPISNDTPEMVQMMFQPPSAQVLGHTVYEEIGLVLSERQDILSTKRIVADICRRYELHVPVDTPVSRLSGGQLARLCIAQTIESGARILVLDEALSELDQAMKATVLPLLQRLTRNGVTVILITHDMEDALWADEVIVLHQGQCVEHCTTQTFFYGYDISRQHTPCQAHQFEEPFSVQVANELSARTGKRFTPRSASDWSECGTR